jgi:hypothetical protein
VAFSEWLNETVLWPVPHRQIVLTVPKMLRIYFRYDRRLLGKLCRLASRVITKSFRALAGRSDLQPGMVVCVQTFGNFANFHPRLHVLVTDGGFAADGTFTVLPKVSLSGMEQLFRHRVLKKITWSPGRSVIYRTKMVRGPNRNFQVYDPLDFLAAVTAHIPDKGEHLVRYYG